MCAHTLTDEQLALLERRAELERTVEFLEEQLLSARRRESLLEAHITELYYRASVDESLSHYLGKSDEEFPEWAENRAAL